jgi:hypothetical protein
MPRALIVKDHKVPGVESEDGPASVAGKPQKLFVIPAIAALVLAVLANGLTVMAKASEPIENLRGDVFVGEDVRHSSANKLLNHHVWILVNIDPGSGEIFGIQ